MISASLLGGRCLSNLSPETTVPSLDPACCEPNSTASLQEGEVPEIGEFGERARAREERERKGERNVRTEVGKKVTLQRVGALQGTYVGTRPAESTVTASASSSSAARRRSEPADRMPSTPSACPPLLLERAFYDKGDTESASVRAGRLRRVHTQVPESAPPQCDIAKPYARHATGCQATHSSGETQRATQQRKSAGAERGAQGRELSLFPGQFPARGGRARQREPGEFSCAPSAPQTACSTHPHIVAHRRDLFFICLSRSKNLRRLSLSPLLRSKNRSPLTMGASEKCVPTRKNMAQMQPDDDAPAS
jgi:hypothetical protein